MHTHKGAIKQQAIFIIHHLCVYKDYNTIRYTIKYTIKQAECQIITTYEIMLRGRKVKNQPILYQYFHKLILFPIFHCRF